ncbi:hypothetical protein FQN53_002264 [Emmonsiellopsis sp. PD_33]|nr:hypothetical protein FQN53_002264 [Emmonsiellopsis sp. PD_33]
MFNMTTSYTMSSSSLASVQKTEHAKLEDCTIVWLCPLEVELRAAIAMLDTVFEDIPPIAKGQNVIYTIGKVGSHNVAVVGYYQESGLAVSGSMVAEVLRDLPNLRWGLLVGIAGGIPSPGRDMQLGDVAVAVPEDDRPGVVGYDLGKAEEGDDFELKHWQNSTDPILRSVITVIRARDESGFRRHLNILKTRPEFRKPGFPPPGGDWSPVESDHDDGHPTVHYGTILSGNTVVRSAARRNYLRDRYGGIAIEMEAAGMMTRLPVAVIRGISDFADGSKGDEWQAYAAVAAAAFAKEVLTVLPSDIPDTRKCLPPTPFANQDLRLALALPDKWTFAGREEELAYLEQELGFPSKPPLQKSVVGLWGLSGVGKSQLASTFVKQQRSRYPEREIFWISGDSQETFEQSVIDMLRAPGNLVPAGSTLSVENSHEKRMGLVNSLFEELQRLDDPRWLLVVDGVNVRQDSNDVASFNIHKLVARLKRGYILLISRRRDAVEHYHSNRQIKGLKDTDVVDLLELRLGPRLTRGGDMEELSQLLHGFPLALRLAISTISRYYRFTIRDYINSWKSHGYGGESEEVDDLLVRSVEVGFRELEATAPAAVKVLTLFSFLDHRDLWYELCSSATADKYPFWLRKWALQRTKFQNYYPLLADLSFVEVKCSANGRKLWEVHPAIQMVARRRAARDEQEYICSAISLVAAHVPRSYENNFWEKMQRLEPHADKCWAYIRKGKWGPRTNLTELESLGRLFRHVGRYEKASQIYRMIEHGLMDVSLSLQRKKMVFLADVYTNLGLVYISQQKFDDALDKLRRSFNLRRNANMQDPEARMSITYNQGIVFMMKGQLDRANEYFREAAAHFAKPAYDSIQAESERKRLYVRILNDMGEVYLRREEVDAAIAVFDDILTSQTAELGASHPTIVSTKLNLGRAYRKRGQFKTTSELLNEVITIYTGWWGRHHPDTMRAIDELALAYMEEAERKKAAGMVSGPDMQLAEELLNEVLGFYSSTFGEKSDLAKRIRTNLQYLESVKGGDHVRNSTGPEELSETAWEIL